MSGKKKKKKSYALPCMLAILTTALLLTACGHLLRRTLLRGLPQYAEVPGISIPMMLLQDSGPLREAREHAAWEAGQISHELASAPAPAQTAPPEPSETPEPPEAQEPPDTLITIGAEESEPESEAESPQTESETPAGDETPLEDETETQPEEEEREPVPESFFDNTLFIGDSKTDEMRTWYRLGRADYFCDVNFSVYNVFDKTASDDAFKNAKLDRVLKRRKYDQVYIILGYNESGYPYGGLMEQFEYVIRRVHDAQPDARIILHGVMHANRSVSQSYWAYSVENLEKVNDGLRAMADCYAEVYYVDCNEAFCDENGYLLSNVSLDGEHLLPDYSKQWAQEIRKRAITD